MPQRSDLDLTWWFYEAVEVFRANELDHHHLVNGRVRVSHFGGDASAHLVQAAKGLGQFAVFPNRGQHESLFGV